MNIETRSPGASTIERIYDTYTGDETTAARRLVRYAERDLHLNGFLLGFECAIGMLGNQQANTTSETLARLRQIVSETKDIYIKAGTLDLVSAEDANAQPTPFFIKVHI